MECFFLNKKETNIFYENYLFLFARINKDLYFVQVKVKVRINLNGNFLVSMASLTRKEEAMVEEQQDPKMEQSEKQEPAPAAADKKDDKMETAPPAETNDKGWKIFFFYSCALF